MKPSYVSPILKRLARKMGITLHLEPEFQYVGQITRADGSKCYFRNTNFDLNPLGSTEIARDKAYASYFMKLMKYPVIEGREFFTRRWCRVLGETSKGKDPKSAWKYAQSLGLPVIVKPNSKSQGSGVCLVRNHREFLQAVRNIEQRESVFLVQRQVTGCDFRIAVLDGEVISAYRRLPLSVVGDGKSTVRQLLERKQRQFPKQGRDTIIDIDDFRMTNMLRTRGMNRGSVPKHGERIELLANANLSTGGDAVDVTERMHPKWKELCVRLTRDMGLRYCGVDLMVQSEDMSDWPADYVIIEINAAPGLDHYASMGKKQQQIVESMYAKVLLAMYER